MIGIKANTTGIEGYINRAAKHMRKEVALGVRDQLVLIEQQHKNKETNKGGSDRAVDRKWTSRTGELRKSFHRAWKPGSLIGAYGSDHVRARVIEEGGTIKAKGTYLTIPTEHAPKGVWARDVEGLAFIQSLKGQPLLVKPQEDGSFITMYILRKQVKLPPRPALDRAIKATEKSRNDRMDLAVDRALGGGNA